MDNQELQRLKNKYDIIGNDAALNTALETAVAVAPTDLTVLVTGESGVGKENIPKIIHQNSLRKTGKYFAVNCGAIPEGTIDSELFGHEKGSFTGATETRKGYFEEANGGTLFLDEIGELPLSSQSKLLRVLQSGEFIKVGSSKVEKTDVRVIAATNVNLWYAVGQGKFRQDLYYRLNAIQITMPALRDRKDDIYLFFRKFTSDFSEKFGMRKIVLTHEAIEMLRAYRWPGNIRQLKNVTETLSALESQKAVSADDRCTVDAQTLGHYLPKDDASMLPVKSSTPSGDTMSASDKQALFNAIYTLGQRVSALESFCKTLSETPRHETVPVIEESRIESTPWQRDEPSYRVPVSGPSFNAASNVPSNVGVSHQSPEEQLQRDDLSVQKNYEELIVRALEKYHGNRKLAARELGISERTLYRKLPDEYKKGKSNEDEE